VGVVDLELVGRQFQLRAKREAELRQWYAGRQTILRELQQ
jgi:hypothetical protein